MTITSEIWHPSIAAAAPDVGGPLVRTPGYTTDLLLVLAAGLGLFVILMLWVQFGRRKSSKRGKHSHKHSPHRSSARSRAHASTDGEEPSHGRRSRRRRRRTRRSQRERNPTLAETGGLPPPRPPESSSAA